MAVAEGWGEEDLPPGLGGLSLERRLTVELDRRIARRLDRSTAVRGLELAILQLAKCQSMIESARLEVRMLRQALQQSRSPAPADPQAGRERAASLARALRAGFGLPEEPDQHGSEAGPPRP